MGKEFRQSLVSMNTRLNNGATLTHQGLVELRDNIRGQINEGNAFISLTKPKNSFTDVADICAEVYDVNLNGDTIELDIRVLQTPKGEFLQEFMEDLEIDSVGIKGQYISSINEDNKITGNISLANVYITADK